MKPLHSLSFFELIFVRRESLVGDEKHLVKTHWTQFRSSEVVGAGAADSHMGKRLVRQTR